MIIANWVLMCVCCCLWLLIIKVKIVISAILSECGNKW